jgi:hypothetical protein
MIGVIADPAEADVVREFFELFKTPWEFYRRDQRYDVLLCAGDWPIEGTAKLIVLYAGRKTRLDHQQNIQTARSSSDARNLSYGQRRIPTYGDFTTFAEAGNALLTVEDSAECVAFVNESNDRLVARIGYDLFSEVRTLLTAGQPLANASLPTLELHIAFLRDLITGSGVSIVEIPPVPDGYQFVACLTHDVDHPAIRRHKWDHTMFGFLYRAIFESLRKLIRGQMSLQDVFKNWAAALKLPFIHLGLTKDFWREFDDRYLELEAGLPSTFFVIPYSSRPGTSADGSEPPLRAAAYGARDIADAIRKLTAAGCEVGLHGIDAWRDCSKGSLELAEIRRLTGTSRIGVRMHWLYYDQQSPSILEAAGADYDSTIGYNGTVGYRAGTTQAFKPLGANHLLELPLHVMDTALFYPGHLGLTAEGAKALVSPILDNVIQFGGILTINWHDRSVAPERLWGEFYRDLIRDLRCRGAWFSTVGEAASWFRKRRSAEFEADPTAVVRAKVVGEHDENLPGLRLRFHRAREHDDVSAHDPQDCADIRFDECVGTGIRFRARR